jgi:hypothetical protein
LPSFSLLFPQLLLFLLLFFLPSSSSSFSSSFSSSSSEFEFVCIYETKQHIGRGRHNRCGVIIRKK